MKLKQAMIEWTITNLAAWAAREENPVIRQAYVDYLARLARQRKTASGKKPRGGL